jgi:hypothetical protein
MVGWGDVRALTPPSRQTVKYYTSRKRKASASERYDYERGEKRRYYGKDNYRSNIGVSRANKPISLLSYSKRNEIIFRPSFDSHRNSYARRSRNVNVA